MVNRVWLERLVVSILVLLTLAVSLASWVLLWDIRTRRRFRRVNLMVTLWLTLVAGFAINVIFMPGNFVF